MAVAFIDSVSGKPVLQHRFIQVSSFSLRGNISLTDDYILHAADMPVDGTMMGYYRQVLQHLDFGEMDAFWLLGPGKLRLYSLQDRRQRKPSLASGRFNISQVVILADKTWQDIILDQLRNSWDAHRQLIAVALIVLAPVSLCVNRRRRKLRLQLLALSS